MKVTSFVAAITVALVAAPGAAAHAVLVSTTPPKDAVLARAPNTVELHFDDPIESAFVSVRVYDRRGRRVDDKRTTHPDARTVGVGMSRPLPRGTYTTAWRVVSEDSHPISGSFVFHVGRSLGNEPGIEVGGGTPREVTVLRDIVRFFDFALLLLVVGGAAALAYPLRSAPETLRERLFLLLAVWASLLVVAALAGIVLQAAVAGGFGLREAFHWSNVSEVLDTRFGTVWLIQAGFAASVALFAVGAPRAALLPALALVATPSLAGHAATGSPLMLVADMTHVAAAALWIGGLALVVVALVAAGPDRWLLAARAVPRFSTLAVISVPLLIAAGVVNAYEEVGTWSALWDTKYGLLVLAKIALLLPVLALGAYNNRFAVPRLRRQIASTAEQRRFLRMAVAELAIVVAILGVTTVLVTEPPAKSQSSPGLAYR